ncbi:MAG: hypothetical protein KIS92_06455 [Planctomycetota bacterium]|nr:hypothetical protein [Planctomycetota bacterium]
MTETPRRWFQIHLATAVVMTLAAGGMVGFNMQVREERDGPLSEIRGYGFPHIFYGDTYFVSIGFSEQGTTVVYQPSALDNVLATQHLRLGALAWDLLLALLAVVLCGAACEAHLRAWRRRPRERH